MTTGSRTEGIRGIGSNGFIRTVGNLTVTGDLVVLGENRALAGTGSFFWEVADANAEYWAFELPSGTSEHVPVLGVGVGLDGVDLGLFNGIVQPTVAVLDADRDSYIALDFQADDVARLRTNAATLRFGVGGTDEIIYTTGALAFQQAATISTTTGDLTIDPASGTFLAGSNVLISDRYVSFTHGVAGAGGHIRGPDGQSLLIGIGTTTEIDYSTGAMAFQQDTAISTTAGALTLAPTTAVVFNSVNAGVTANVNSAQADNPITKMITQVSICANPGDAVTLPTAVAGAVIIVLNDGAQAADVFPASGDNINEAGANTAYSLAVDKNAIFVAHDTTHWSVILTA